MKTHIISIFALFLFLSGCKKSKDNESPTPLTNDYTWYAAKVIPSQDTLKIENSALYYSAQGVNNPNATEQFTMAWAKGGLGGDFEMTIDYENLQSDVSVFNLPFSFSLFPGGSLSKLTSVNLGTNYTMIQYGNGGGAIPSFDTKLSSSGTVSIKRSGSDFKISITKNYLNGNTPAQYVQQSDSLGWFSGNANFNFMVINSLSAQRAKIRWTSFTIKNAGGTIVEAFDSDAIKRQ